MGKPFLRLESQRFGRLLVLSLAGTAKGRTVWNCVCDCGNEVKAVGAYLRRNEVRSCGCLKSEISRNKNIEPVSAGTKFGRLTILEEAGSDYRGQVVYLCKCVCGTSTKVLGYSLRSGVTKSCGCLRKDVIGNLNRTHGLSGTREYQAQAQSKRRARVVEAEGSHSTEDVQEIFAEQEGLCFYCKTPLDNTYTEDHKTPLSRSGSNGRENVCLTCRSCNFRKHTKTAEEFFAVLQET